MNEKQLDYKYEFKKRLGDFIRDEKIRVQKVLKVEEINAIQAEEFKSLGSRAEYWKGIAEIED